jgi:DNA adenine methylase
LGNFSKGSFLVKPLFTWAGGKNKMLKHYLPLMPDDINGYCEPFFGGGAMFIYVQQNYKPKNVVINDKQSGIVNIYDCIKNNYDEFISRLNFLESEYIPKSGPTKDSKGKLQRHCERWHYFMDVRKEHAYDHEKWSKPEEAATLYFLMKVGFNGIFQINKNTNKRYGTPPGLMNQKNVVYDRDVVEWWHQALQNVDILSDNWDKACYLDDAFYFFDPPYRDSFADYGNPFSDDELLELIKFSDNQKQVFLANRDKGDGWFEKNKLSLDITTFPITYTAGRRKKVTKKNQDGEEKEGFEAKPATEVLLYRSKK